MDDVLHTLPTGLILTSHAAAGGVGVDALQRAVRSGLLVRLRHGAYLRASDWEPASPDRRYRWVVEAAGRQLHDPVFTHESAAVIWGLPLIAPPRIVHVLGSPSPGQAAHGFGVRGGVHRHGSATMPTVVRVDGLRLTTVPDTLVTLAAARSVEVGLAAADHALRVGLATAESLCAAVCESGRRHGVRRARVVAELADAKAESPGESVSRARIHLEGLVAPELQVPFTDRTGRRSRVDFWWPQVQVIGEFDGRMKYRVDGVADRRSVEDRVWAEKRREDRLRSTGVRVVRWTWADLWRPGALPDLLRTAGVPLRSR